MRTRHILPLLAAVALAACNDIDEQDRYIDIDVVEAQRTVLLTEFTGQKCINCAPAHQVMADLLKQYAPNLVAVSIHGGGDAFSIGEGQSGAFQGLRNAESEAYCNEYGIRNYPSGIVDLNGIVEGPDRWAASIRAALQQPTDILLDAHATLSPDGTTIDITAEATSATGYSGHLRLWIVESDIVSLQLLPTDSYDREYTHNHVFRAAVNDLQGTPVTLQPATPHTVTGSIAVKEFWNTANIAVVAYVYNNDGVAQATETHLTTTEP